MHNYQKVFILIYKELFQNKILIVLFDEIWVNFYEKCLISGEESVHQYTVAFKIIFKKIKNTDVAHVLGMRVK